MRRIRIALILCLLLGSFHVHAQAINFDRDKFEANKVSISIERVMGKQVLKVVKDATVEKVDEPTFVKLKDVNFKNGTIEVKVLSKLLENAPEFARGFIGIAFRINDNNSKFEGIYLRPANARAPDQVRRNHSIQYFSYPDFKFDRLRKESPEKYESYADMDLNAWIKMKIVIKDSQAELFLNDSSQPALVVNDLKHGRNSSGSVGLWVDIGTEGFFSDLNIQKEEQE